MAKKIFGDTSAPNMSVVTIKRGGRTLARGLVTTAVAAALVTGMGGMASAGTTGSTTGNVAVTSAISLTGNTTSFILTGVPGSAPANAAAVTYSVTTNNLAGYTVTVQAAAATLAPTAFGNTDSIPIAALSVSGDTPGTYTPVSTTAQVVHAKATRSAEAGDTLTDGYQVVIPFVNQDTYHVTLNYVATTL